MTTKKGGKAITTISFDEDVMLSLEEKCNRSGISVSAFVNMVIRKAVMSEYEYYRQLAKNCASELSKYQTLMETATDKPKKETNK